MLTQPHTSVIAGAEHSVGVQCSSTSLQEQSHHFEVTKNGCFYPKPSPRILFTQSVRIDSTPMEDHTLSPGLPQASLEDDGNGGEGWTKRATTSREHGLS